MPSCNRCLSNCSLCFILVFTGFGVWAMVMGGLTTGMFLYEKHVQSVYKLTSCFIKNYTSTGRKCSTRNCTGAKLSRSCETTYFTCYDFWYTLSYNVSSSSTERELNANCVSGVV